MSIDYSKPGYKEMFANYGFTVLLAQGLEKTLLLLLGAVECLEEGAVDKEDLHRVFDKYDRKTLGQLIHKLKSKVPLPDNLEADLITALEKRNYLIHRFFLEKFDVNRLAADPKSLSEELRPMRDLFIDVYKRTDTVIEAIENQIGIQASDMNDKANNLLRKYQSSEL